MMAWRVAPKGVAAKVMKSENSRRVPIAGPVLPIVGQVAAAGRMRRSAVPDPSVSPAAWRGILSGQSHFAMSGAKGTRTPDLLVAKVAPDGRPRVFGPTIGASRAS